MEVSNTEDTGDSAIFHDDNEGGGNDTQTGEIRLAKPVPAKPRAQRLDALPDASNNRGSKKKSGALASKGGRPEKNRDGGEVIGKGKKREMDEKDIGVSTSKEKKGKIQDGDDEDDNGKDMEGETVIGYSST